MKPPRNIKNILITALLLETLCVTYALYIPFLAGWISTLYTFSGLAIAFALLWMKPVKVVPKINLFSFTTTLNRYRWLLMGIVLIAMIRFAYQWMEDDPLRYQDADMLPIIKTMCERFLSGAWKQVYAPIHEIWGGTHPIYLPAMWLPFCVPVWLHIDLRWVTVCLLFIVFCLFIWRVHPLRKQALPVFASGFLLFWWLFADEKASLVPYTEEGVVIFFYVLLTIALINRNAWLIGIAASLCVLSRYALVGWLPAMVLYFSYTKDWKGMIRFAVTGITFFVVLVLLPFGWDILKSLIALPTAYIDFTRRVWHDAPHVFMQSPGWAKFFGPQRIAKLHYLLVVLSFIVPVTGMFVTLQLHKKYDIPVQNLPLATLKITLVIFYSFIDVPYLYLFYTSSFVSLIAVTYFIMPKSPEQLMKTK